MKKYIGIAILTVFILGSLFVRAQETNAVATKVSVVETNAVVDPKAYGNVEITLGGGGTRIPSTGESAFGVDLTVAYNPFKALPNIWLGVAQSVAWEPSFSGSTDFYSDWSTHLYKDLWLNTGWSVGALYDPYSSPIWRTGPELSFEYYVGDSSFIFAGVNYDITSRGDNGIRYSFGIGLTF